MSKYPELLRKIRQAGVASPASEWLIKALDPASAGVGSGLPDFSSMCVMRPDYTVVGTIPTNAAAGSGTWDCIIVVPPGDCTAVYWASAPQTGGGTPVDFTAPFAPTGWAAGIIGIAPSTDSPVQITGINAWPTTGTTSPLGMRVPVSRSLAARTRYRGVTVELVAAAVADQGMVYAGQFPPNYAEGAFAPWTPTTNHITGFFNYAVGVNMNLPFDESTMALMRGKLFEGPAREGVYLPTRLAGPTQLFTPTSTPSVWHSSDNGVFGFVRSMGSINAPRFLKARYYLNASGPPETPPVTMWPIGAALQSAGTSNGVDTGFDQCNVGVIIFRGLSGPGGVGGASLMVRARVGMELIANPLDPDRVYCTPPVPASPRALELYYRMAQGLPDAFPASFNSMGALIPVLSSIAGFVAPYVAPFVKAGVQKLTDWAFGASGSPDEGQLVTYKAPPAPVLKLSSRAGSVARSVKPRARVAVVKGPSSTKKKGAGKRR